MKNFKFYIIPLLIVVAVVVFRFYPECLMFAVGGNEKLPSGTFISWILLASWSFTFYLMSKNNIIKSLLFFNGLFSLFWGVIGFLISGNWAFNLRIPRGLPRGFRFYLSSRRGQNCYGSFG